jgi:drug/metabolite transporter (DMT)-like permease
MGVALAAAAAISWGSSDYIAGHATRRSTALAVAALAQLTGLTVVVLVAPLVGGAPTAADLGWGALAGVANGMALVALYRGLAIGPMSIVAPATAGLGAIVPVAIGTALGQRPTGVTLAGVVLALVSIVALSTSSEDEVGHAPTRRLLRSAPATLIAGVGFGVFYVALDRTHRGAGLWPLVAVQAASVPLLWAVLLVRNARDLRAATRAAPAAAAAGVLDIAAASATLIAFRHQSLPVVAVITSLYPAATVALAGLVGHERVGARRLVWGGVALLAVVLIAAS